MIVLNDDCQCSFESYLILFIILILIEFYKILFKKYKIQTLNLIHGFDLNVDSVLVG